MECLVRVWQKAVGWTQQRLIAVNAGRVKGNRGGHRPTVFQKFWHQQGRLFKTLPNISMFRQRTTMTDR